MNKRTLVLGLEHFIDKIGYQANSYYKYDIPIKYIVMDSSGYSKRKAEKFQADVTIVSNRLILRIFKTIYMFFLYKPHFVEIYDTGRLTIFYGLVAKLFRCKVILILRGLEFLHIKKNDFRGKMLIKVFNICDSIVAKEENIVKDLESINIDMRKVFSIHNGIIFPEVDSHQQREIDILFLNSVRRERNVHLLIDAIQKLKEEYPEIKVNIVGFTSFDTNNYKMDVKYEQIILKKIQELNLSNNIKLYGFVEETKEFYLNAKIFVLPGDIIFLNHSLLEAMSFGVAPLVTNGEGAEKIIDNGIDGIIVNKTSESLQQGVRDLLLDGKYRDIGMNAQLKIKEKFTMDIWMKKMIAVRETINRKEEMQV